jgi:hypothetical protein
MKKFYPLLIAISVASTAMAQPTIPAAPLACSASNCTTNSTIDVCPPLGNTVVSSFTGGTYNRGNNGNNLGTNAVWRFRNIAVVSGITVNAEITINAISNAVLNSLDDNTAVDQSNASIASFFAPRIGPDQNLNGTNRRGYVEFTISFFRNATGTNNNTNADFANTVNLLNINYVHYDIDGNDANGVSTGTAGNWFRETGVARRISAANPMILANATSELVSYSYTDASNTWSGFAGSVCERDGVTRCSEIASSFSYNGSLPSITFRLGYDYNGGNNIGAPVRQYGTRLGCFNFPDQVTLPVRLIGFSGSFRNGQTLLSWTTENEVNFDHYDVERSVNANEFVAIGAKQAQAGNASKLNYSYTDDLSASNDKVFYYRLRMVDIDGKFSYSNTIMVRKDQSSVKGILLSPNPVTGNGAVTIRISTESKKNIEVRVIDATGKLVLKQQNQVAEGLNSISINNQGRLQPGIYTVQIMADDEILSSKLSVIR